MKRTHLYAALWVLVPVSILVPGAQSQPRYSVTGLDPTHSLKLIDVRAINNVGQTIGMTYELPASNERALRLGPGGAVQIIPGFTPGAVLQGVDAINDNGQVVGGNYNLPHERAYVWNPGQLTSTDLGDFVGGTGTSMAHAINNDGLVVGAADAPGGARFAFVWSPATGLHNLGDFINGGNNSSAQAINRQGDVAGYGLPGVYGHAAFWPAGGGAIRDLGSLPGGTGESAAFGLNDLDVAVGYSMNDDGHRAVRWTADGTIHNLGIIPGTTDSIAYGINNLGQIIGISFPETITNELQIHPFVWTDQHGMEDLNDLLDASGNGWTLAEVHGINQAGQIAGLGLHNGVGEAFILTPVPEPCQLQWLLASTIALLRSRRR
jgi:probable HAF family extracellular repeat protein